MGLVAMSCQGPFVPDHPFLRVFLDDSSIVEPILIGYKVLMITNTNEILLECVDQTSST